MSPAALRVEAAGAAGALPPLLAQASALAATVQAGAHARRREGAGERFWSHRPYRPGDEPRRIDWRRSARGDAVLVREHEQAQAATVRVWPDRRATLRWRSSPALPSKAERGVVLALALAALLGRGGERCGLLGGPRPLTGVQAVDRLALAIETTPQDAPPPAAAGAGGLVVISDFLEPAETLAERFAGWRAQGVGAGWLVRVIDPAEADFPYAGATLFQAVEGREHRRLGRAEAAAEAYREAWRAHGVALAAAAEAAGFCLLEHRTSQPPAAALTALWRAVAGQG